jgi:flagellar biosynthesis/type III secretory pathway protein FliH
VPEPFRSLASIFAGSVATPERERISSDGFRPAPASLEPSAARAVSAPDERIVELLDSFVAELARLRARASERLEERAQALLADLARHVLARELAAAPVAIGALLAEALAELEAGTDIVVRVCASDAERLGGRYAVVAADGLVPGDFVVEMDDGHYDAALQTRFEAMLASHRIAL